MAPMEITPFVTANAFRSISPNTLDSTVKLLAVIFMESYLAIPVVSLIPIITVALIANPATVPPATSILIFPLISLVTLTSSA